MRKNNERQKETQKVIWNNKKQTNKQTCSTKTKTLYPRYVTKEKIAKRNRYYVVRNLQK